MQRLQKIKIIKAIRAGVLSDIAFKYAQNPVVITTKDKGETTHKSGNNILSEDEVKQILKIPGADQIVVEIIT